MDPRKPRAGLLPLYLQLYDEVKPEWRETLAGFVRKVAAALAARGVEIVPAEICRLAPEFRKAVAGFEQAGVDCIVTLHLAYSPSLESAEALARTKLPIVILDTTIDHYFGPGVPPDRIGFNHGVHGVMDMASVLRRRGRAFEIVAGHVDQSDVLDRAAGMVRAAFSARCFRSTKALRVGESFKGMGDFAVPAPKLKSALGISVKQVPAAALAKTAAGVSEADIDAEVAEDRRRFIVEASADAHCRAVRVGLALRRYLEEGGFDAFSMNFLAFKGAGKLLDAVPFLECCKAMARGIGYAGEGDVLTAALVGALQRGFGRTTFTEIFCPDWKGNSLFLSHMGEINPEVAAARPQIVEHNLPYTGTGPSAVLTCAPASGPAVYANLAPGPALRSPASLRRAEQRPRGAFDVIAAPVEVLGDTDRADMKRSVRGWIRPARPVAEFLEEYSRLGGTHHSALVLDTSAEAMQAFAAFAGLGFKLL